MGRTLGLLPDGFLSGEPFPARHCDLDVSRIDIHRVARAPEFLGRDQRRAAAAERVIHGVAGAGVIQERYLEQADRLLRAVAGYRVVGVARAAEWIANVICAAQSRSSSRITTGERNHQGLGNELIDGAPPVDGVNRIRRRQRLGWLLNYYARAA